MEKITILALSGSLRRGSYATKLLHAFGALAPENVTFTVADLSQLPIYNQDDELPEPQFLKDFKAQIEPADGVLFVTPEYNRSIPPVLKNALDWASRPQAPVGNGQWAGRVAAIAGVSPYSLGAVAACFHLRQVLTFLNMPVIQQPEFYLSMAAEKFDAAGNLTDEATAQHITKLWNVLIAEITARRAADLGPRPDHG